MLAAREADFCMNDLELTGRARTHIVELKSPDCSLHYETAASLLAMRDAAARSGIDLVPISSYRDFDRQVTLWNRKWRGERPLYDRAGKPLEHARLSESALVDAILCWSAIPGGSRHHWGSDLDVIDAAAMPAGYQVQLLPEEYAPGGVFGRLNAWLGESADGIGADRAPSFRGVHAQHEGDALRRFGGSGSEHGYCFWKVMSGERSRLRQTMPSPFPVSPITTMMEIMESTVSA
jgi:hypothetical protein